MSHFPAKVFVNLKTIASNIEVIRSLIKKDTQIMAIVKANAYGHGLVEVAKTCIENGVNFLGVAKISEALQLRSELGDDVRIFSWIYGPEAPFQQMVEAKLDLSVSTVWEIEKIATATKKLNYAHTNYAHTDNIPKIHIKIDTGFSRNGFVTSDPIFEEALLKLDEYERQGLLKLEGVWSHLACSDGKSEDAKNITNQQAERFKKAVNDIKSRGFSPNLLHICASPGIINYPELQFDMVRPGILIYGVSPNYETIEVEKLGFKRALRLDVQMNNVKPAVKGSGISYGHTYHVSRDTKIGVVPLGYADGIFRNAGGEGFDGDKKIGAPLLIKEQGGKNTIGHIAGRVCMDQFLVDIDNNTCAKAGDWVTLFGWEEEEPSVDEWAKVCETISYEILTKITEDAPRVYLNGK